MEKRGRKVDDERASGKTRHVEHELWGWGVKGEPRGEAVSRSESGSTRRRGSRERVVYEGCKVESW